MNRRVAEQRGRSGEAIAAWYLRLKGWRILAQRVRTAAGEVDIVARRGRTVAFVEVKWRRDSAARDDSVDSWRLRRVARAAETLAPRFVAAGQDMRIDAILLAPGRWPHHLPNIWQP